MLNVPEKPATPSATHQALTRKDLALAIGDRLPSLSRTEAARILDMVIDEMTSALETEGTLNLRSFGVFDVRKKRARQGRNPRTGEAATITERKVVSFKASPVMITAMNSEDKLS